MILLRIVYLANVLVAGWIGITSLFFPEKAIISVFENAYKNTEIVQLVGALWLGICLVSFLGLYKPNSFTTINL
jgi:hypothetical protein